MSFAVWGKLLWCQKVLFQCDNSSVVTLIQKGSCKDPTSDSSPVHLIIFNVYYDIDVIATHIPGVANATADHLLINNLLLFFAGSTTSNPTPTSVTTEPC